MATLQQLLLLGTERVASPPTAPHPSLESAWSTLDWTHAKEIATLEAAVLAGTAGLAGQLSSPAPAAIPPAPADATPEAGRPAAHLLSQLLEGDFRGLLTEWLELCAQHHRRVPAYFLPRLLGIVSTAERPLLATVAGARGRWLAAQNPLWSWLTQTSEAELSLSVASSQWETGTDTERLAALHALRKADPTAGRGLLEKSWSQDPPAFRETALGELSVGLSSADEAFLETCLRDRRREIRQQAQVLLCRLPGSGFVRRMTERATRLLVFKKSFLSKKLEVVLPSAFEAEWKLDGIEEKPPVGTGEKTFWTRQILECVEIEAWKERLSLTTDALVGLAVSSEWSDLLLGAWYQTLRFTPDAELAETLFQSIVHRPSCLPTGVHLSEAVATLLGFCPPEVRWKLAEKNANDTAVLWASLPQLTVPSGQADHATAILRALAPALRDGLVPGGSPQTLLAARCLPISLRGEAERLLQREQGLTKTAETFLRALELRAQLHTSFSASA